MILLSKSQIKLITSLQQKKYRIKTGLFVAEGKKTIQDLLDEDIELHVLYSTKESSFDVENSFIISETQLNKISFLKKANTCLAVFKIPEFPKKEDSGILLMLDDVRDPGNLGTIIRLCDWYGIKQIVCSQNTVDCFNPKVIQATMGSIARVAIYYLDILGYVKKTTLPVYGACMDGENVYDLKLPKNAILVMGNEAHGISKEITEVLSKKITIPKFGPNPKVESLNVAMATAILLSEYRRK